METSDRTNRPPAPADAAPHLLFVDDDTRIRNLLKQYLAENGFRVTVAGNAAEARRRLEGLDFDLLVIDVMMPGENGVDLTKALRAQKDVPILMLTALSETDSRITGLEAGADDYLPKPFDPRELILRINAILRRVPRTPANVGPRMLQLGPLRYDLERGELWSGDDPVRLTASEAQLMRVLAARPGEVLSRLSLVEELGRDGEPMQERAIDVQITRLRRKIESDPRQPRYLQTVRGEGYLLAPD